MEILDKIHAEHQGVHKCKERARMTVWWPGLNKAIQGKVSSCTFCEENQQSQRKEPLITTLLPERPWQRIATDLCEFKNEQFLVMMHYYSRYLAHNLADNT